MPGIGQLSGWAFDEARFMHGGPGPGSKDASEYFDKRPATKAAAAIDFDFAILRPYLISVFAALSIDEGWLSLHFEAARAKDSGYRIKTPLGDAITCVLRHRVPGKEDHRSPLYWLLARSWPTYAEWEMTLAQPPALSAAARSTASLPRANRFSAAELVVVRLHLQEWLRFTDLASSAEVRTWILSIDVYTASHHERKRFNGPERLLLASLGIRLGSFWHTADGKDLVAPISRLTLALQNGILENTLLPRIPGYPSRDIRMVAVASLATHSAARENLLAMYRIVVAEPAASFVDFHAKVESLRGGKKSDKYIVTQIAYGLCPESNSSERNAVVADIYGWSFGQSVETRTTMFSWTLQEDLQLLKLSIELNFYETASVAKALAIISPINPSSKACKKRLVTLSTMPGVPALCCLKETLPAWWTAMGLDEQRTRGTNDQLGRMLEGMDDAAPRVLGGSDYTAIDQTLFQADLAASSIYPVVPITDRASLESYMIQPLRQGHSFGISDQEQRTRLAVQIRAFDRLGA